MSQSVANEPKGTLRPRPRRVLLALLAFIAVGGGAVSATCAVADMVLTTDGKWVPPPPEGMTLGPDEEPTPEMLAESATTSVDAAYDTVKLTGKTNATFPAVKVLKIFGHDRVLNEKFKLADNDASSGFWKEAAEGYAAAADELKGFGKQEALYLQVQAHAAGVMISELETSITELLQAFPKSWFFCDAYVLRAKLAMTKGDVAGATKALEAIKTAPGMNSRDAFRAEYMRVFLTLEGAGKFDEALAAYRALVAAIDRSPEAAQSLVTKQKALAGTGNCLLQKGKGKEAGDVFKGLTESRNADVLAACYAGLGDLAFTEAKSLQSAKNLEEAKKRLEEAATHYLRVTIKYRTDVEEQDAIIRALLSQAKAFTALYDMTKDVESGNRALRTYQDFGTFVREGPIFRQAVKDAKDLKKRMDEAAAAEKPKPPTPPGSSPPAMGG